MHDQANLLRKVNVGQEKVWKIARDGSSTTDHFWPVKRLHDLSLMPIKQITQNELIHQHLHLCLKNEHLLV